MTKLLNNRLVITPVTEYFVPSGPPFISEINPSSISMDFSVKYSPTEAAAGTIVDIKNFNTLKSLIKLKINLLISLLIFYIFYVYLCWRSIISSNLKVIIP